LWGGATLTWFTNRTNNLIQYNLNTFTLDQITHAFIQGMTLELRTPQYRGITTSLNVTNLYRAQNVDTGARLANDPVFAANLRLDYLAGNAPTIVDSLGFSVRMAGERGVVDHTAPLFDQPAAFTNLDAYLRLRAGRSMLVTLRGYNLGNERYAAVGGYPMPGRAFMLELSTK
jgi:outer membrane receptor protein involved in Fe transport